MTLAHHPPHTIFPIDSLVWFGVYFSGKDAMLKVITFEEAINRTKGEGRALLIGNGFSAPHFNYTNILEKSGLEQNGPIFNLFKNLNTVDFEMVVRSLEEAAVVGRSYDNNDHADKLERDAQKIREALVVAVKTIHPEYREEIKHQLGNASGFLYHFNSVFSLNYDLLLYWVMLEFSFYNDGFGRGGRSNNGRFHGPFREDAYCNVFNLHGGLHLFEDGVGDVHKALKHGDGLIATIDDEIIGKKKMPIYVAEGTSISKMKKINSVPYLRHCYQQLKNNTATLFIYGHSANESDEHIYQAIFDSKTKHVYFGIHRPDDNKIRKIDAQLSKYAKKYAEHGEVPYSLFDSESAQVWGDATQAEHEEV